MDREPFDLDPPFIEGLLGKIRDRTVPLRVGEISAYFLGRPYRETPLIGSQNTPEVFTASLRGFDCVTYVESVLALARSRDSPAFVENLRRIRYLEGEIDWKTRNHYMTAWIDRNRRQGLVADLTEGAGLIERERRLSVVPGLRERRVKVRSIKKTAFIRRLSETKTGDLVFFGSTRRNLDVFHSGILVRTPDGLEMRHAARSRGCVVEQDFQEFLSENRMTGVILVRPAKVYPKAA